MNNKIKSSLKDCYNIYLILVKLDLILNDIEGIEKDDAVKYLV